MCNDSDQVPIRMMSLRFGYSVSDDICSAGGGWQQQWPTNIRALQREGTDDHSMNVAVLATGRLSEHTGTGLYQLPREDGW